MFYRKTTGFSPEPLSMSGDYAYITTPDGKTSVIKPKFRNFFTFSEIGKEMKSDFLLGQIEIWFLVGIHSDLISS